ncbi:MAG: AAA family ATPase [Candidatus Poribacteria bacterium]|nr:AAA family ATPase [Candidatus Poribacteria bacterium]
MPQQEVHLRDYLTILRKHDFVICLSVLLILGTALVVSLWLPKTYSTTALIHIQPTSSSPIPSSGVFQSVLPGGVDLGEMETIGQRFATESMLSSAIESLETAGIKGTIYLPSIGHLQRNLKARKRPDTQYIELSLDLTEAEGGERNSALLVNQLIREYQGLRRGDETSKARNRRKLLKDEIANLSEKIKGKEDETVEFINKMGSRVTWNAQLTSVLDRQVRLLDQEAQLERTRSVTQLEFDRLEKEISDYPEEIRTSEIIRNDPIWRNFHERLMSLQQYRIGRRELVGEKSSELRATDAEIRDLQDKLNNFETDLKKTSENYGKVPQYISLRTEIMGLETRLRQADHNLDQINLQLDKVNLEFSQLVDEIPENEFNLSTMKTEINALYELKKEITKQHLESEILVAEAESANMDDRVKGGIEVVDAAVPRKIPVRPRIGFIVIIAGGIGCAVGISITLLREYFGDNYRRPEEIQSDLGIFYLGDAEPQEQNPFSETISDSYRTIAANLNLTNPEIDKQILMLASCDFCEDVSAVAANLGAAMASTKNSVLIVDCNLPQPKQHRIFNIQLDANQVNALENDAMEWNSIIQRTHIPNLDLLPARLLSSNPTDFLRMPRLNVLIQQLRERYELILLDAPPILPTSDSLVLGVHSDGIILIVDLSQTHRETLRTSQNRIVHTQVQQLGFITT